ncbi:MAG: 4-alpha-glucanotransferase [Neisseria sp.]|uniref:4-alpha-glucanotransferase n=1 Tax=Neisseria sp. TaxID=192066 RepID=UPI0026DDAE1D|nr:4-alpha-glucanotransferase [Neisseria sp.]MDO4640841.1 4-alpha-glucanotransferase [Neisseria sp.]
MDLSEALKQEAAALGIALSHYDIDGNLIQAKPESVEYFVRLFQTTVSDRHSLPDAHAEAEFDDILVAYEGQNILCRTDKTSLPPNSPLDYALADENGRMLAQGHSAAPTLALDPLPYGYYTLTLTASSQTYHLFLIVSPTAAYRPDALQTHQAWGLNIQLYSLRSARNWGIGDFGDLRCLVEQATHAGADFIGLNPLHALYPAVPEWASPYSASSRRWLNFIYLDIEAIPEFSSKAVQNWWQNSETQQEVSALRQTEWVDYAAVCRLKLAALEKTFAFFETSRARKTTQRRAEFEAFLKQHGNALLNHALFDALDAQAHSSDNEPETRIGWLGWRQEWQTLSDRQRQQLLEQHARPVRFYAWLQWLAAQQLADIRTLCGKTGMKLGLYGDLAVSSSRGSADVWGDRALYCTAESIGAPPDPLGPVGQNWNLPPWHPHRLVKRGLRPFIEILRANMQYFGVIRIDHVMGLFRLWLIPQNQHSSDGLYVYYPFDAMMAALTVESHRNRCLVIGEDLGTVPNEVRSKLNQYRILSYCVLYFACAGNRFPPPQDFPPEAFATIGTHDLPSLKSYWHCNDLRLFADLGILDHNRLKPLYDRRLHEKQALLDVLHRDGFLPPEYEGDALSMAMHDGLNRAIHRYLAACRSKLVGVQLENLLDMEQPFNLPGTSVEYPNWRRKMPVPLETLFDDEHILKTLKEVGQTRQNNGAAA